MPPRRRKPPRAGALTDLPPLKIIRSIIILQLSYYLIAGVIIMFTALVAGQKLSLALIFDWRTVRGDNTIGWMLGGVWLLVSLFAYASSVSFSFSFSPRQKEILETFSYLRTTFLLSRVVTLLLLVSRSKLVPDFALTLHLLHLLTTSLYARSLPTNLLWWGLQAGSAGIMISLGVWACRYRELRPMSFGLGGTTDAGHEARREEGTQGEPKTDGHFRGERERGRNRDGGPSYEMVAVKEEAEESV